MLVVNESRSNVSRPMAKSKLYSRAPVKKRRGFGARCPIAVFLSIQTQQLFRSSGNLVWLLRRGKILLFYFSSLNLVKIILLRSLEFREKRSDLLQFNLLAEFIYDLFDYKNCSANWLDFSCRFLSLRFLKI